MRIRSNVRHPLPWLAVAAVVTAGCQSLTKQPQCDSATTTSTTTLAKNSEVELANHEVPAAPPPQVVKTDKKPRWKRASKSPEVKRLNILWSDATGEVGGVARQSGFAAKVYLIGQPADAPIQTEGRFNFYAWNDRSSKTRVKPDRIWSFPEDQVARLVSTDSVGAYYSFWLPVGSADHPQHNFSLQAAFTPAVGKPVLSQPASVSLPGRGSSVNWKKKSDILNVDGYQQGVAATTKDEARPNVPRPPSQPRVATLQQHRSP